MPPRPVRPCRTQKAGGLALLARPGVGIAAGRLLLAAAAALGMRRLALAATGLAVLYAVGLRL